MLFPLSNSRKDYLIVFIGMDALAFKLSNGNNQVVIMVMVIGWPVFLSREI